MTALLVMVMMPSKQREAARPHEECRRLVGEEWSTQVFLTLLDEFRSKAFIRHRVSNPTIGLGSWALASMDLYLAEGERTGLEENIRQMEEPYAGDRRFWCEKTKSCHFIKLSEWVTKSMTWQGGDAVSYNRKQTPFPALG